MHENDDREDLFLLLQSLRRVGCNSDKSCAHSIAVVLGVDRQRCTDLWVWVCYRYYYVQIQTSRLRSLLKVPPLARTPTDAQHFPLPCPLMETEWWISWELISKHRAHTYRSQTGCAWAGWQILKVQDWSYSNIPAPNKFGSERGRELPRRIRSRNWRMWRRLAVYVYDQRPVTKCAGISQRNFILQATIFFPTPVIQ